MQASDLLKAGPGIGELVDHRISHSIQSYLGVVIQVCSVSCAGSLGNLHILRPHRQSRAGWGSFKELGLYHESLAWEYGDWMSHGEVTVRAPNEQDS